jgi:single-strand DNA-binding protein
MSRTVKIVILIGNLGNDPEVHTTPDKFQVCTFSLATSRDWKDRNTGEQKSQTNWHSAVVWEPCAVTYA